MSTGGPAVEDADATGAVEEEGVVGAVVVIGEGAGGSRRQPRSNTTRRNARRTRESYNVLNAANMSLSGKAARHLRGLGHALAPVVQIGKDGITDGVVDAAKSALSKHELIKVRVQSEAPVDRKEAASELASRTSSSLAQVLGRTFLLYKRHPKKPKIVLPKE